MTTQLDRQATGSIRYELEIPIEASPEAVWDALTEHTNAWWLPDFHMVGADSEVSLNAEAGGQLIETKADGGSLLWYTVQMVVPGESLHLVGHLAPPWGGPATTMLQLGVRAYGDGALLVVSDAIFGQVDEKSAAAQQEGWTALFGDGLKRFVES